jgi:hypothetical protein
MNALLLLTWPGGACGVTLADPDGFRVVLVPEHWTAR